MSIKMGSLYITKYKSTNQYFDLSTYNYILGMTGIYSVCQKRKIIEGLAQGFYMNLSTYNYFLVTTDI
jgi:hypothetical protein